VGTRIPRRLVGDLYPGAREVLLPRLVLAWSRQKACVHRPDGAVRRRPVLYGGLVPVEDEEDARPDAVPGARVAERAEAEHLASAEVEITNEATWDSGARSFYFDDPAGNVLEIAETDMWPP
jgi:catechol 2,3-dioxygenase-like lactoylglutathione lyase family enzyme